MALTSEVNRLAETNNALKAELELVKSSSEAIDQERNDAHKALEKAEARTAQLKEYINTLEASRG